MIRNPYGRKLYPESLRAKLVMRRMDEARMQAPEIGMFEAKNRMLEEFLIFDEYLNQRAEIRDAQEEADRARKKAPFPRAKEPFYNKRAMGQGR